MIAGDVTLFGPAARYAPERVADAMRRWEERRLSAVLDAIEARQLDRDPEDASAPSIRQVIEACTGEERARLLLAPDFRRWIGRLLHNLAPRADRMPPGAGTAPRATVESVWNLLLVPWLTGGGEGRVRLTVFGDGTVPLAGSGLTIVCVGTARTLQVEVAGDSVRCSRPDGSECFTTQRSVLVDAAHHAGVPGVLPENVRSSVLLSGTAIECVAGESPPSGEVTIEPELERAIDELRAWPAGDALFRAMTRRLVLDPSVDMYSKSASELPGVLFLGRRRTDWLGIAELLVHEATHLWLYEVTRLGPVMPAGGEILHSPFSRERRPAYLVLHGLAAFMAQTMATACLAPDREAVAQHLSEELVRLAVGEREIARHLVEHGAPATPLVELLFRARAELAQALGSK